MLAMDELDELKGRVGGGAMIGSNRVLLTSNDVDLLRCQTLKPVFVNEKIQKATQRGSEVVGAEERL